MKRLALLVALASCATDDPCDAITGACVTLHVRSASVAAIDQLELDLLWGETHATTTTAPASGTTTLPLVTAVALADPGAASQLGVVGAGKLSGTVLGTGAAQARLAGTAHVAIDLVLASPQACVAGSRYCGGDKLAGDPGTLYECNGGGVPLARGACTAGCISRPTLDDACAADGGPCTDGGLYCGGDELAGDPQTLYRCAGGAGIAVMTCMLGCTVVPGQNDTCR
jgi:hypothetical protein